jgi:dolichyl-phosphate beta-glucosyltransferase
MSLKLSLIIPAYNEEKLIGKNLSKISAILDKSPYTWEIVVIDDGSSDATSRIVESLKRAEIKLVKLDKNQGKGAALKAGFLAAKGDYRIFSDADLSVDIETISPFMQKLKTFDVVIASRRVEGSIIEKHQPWLRENMGRVFTLLTQILTGSKVVDFTCGFKGFTGASAKKIFAKSLISRWAYDAELVFLAEKYGYKVCEYPVTWVNRKDTRVRLSKVVCESLRDLIRIRIFNMQGLYD